MINDWEQQDAMGRAEGGCSSLSAFNSQYRGSFTATHYLAVPESHEVVLHQGQDLGVELRVAGQHLQGFIDKSETKIDE